MIIRSWRAAAAAVPLLLVAGLVGVVAPTSAHADGCPTVEAVTGTVTPLPAAGDDLSGCDLSGAALTGIDLSYATLVGTDFTGATLVGSRLDHSDLTGAILDGAQLDGSDVDGAILTGASLRDAYVDVAYFDNAVLIDADFTGAYLRGVSFAGASAAGALFVDAELPESPTVAPTFTGADLTDTDFTRSISRFTSFVGATLTGIDLTDARLINPFLEGVLLDTATLTGLSASGVQGTPGALPVAWRLANQRLIGPSANLRSAQLQALDLHGVDLTGADLHLAKLNGTNLRGATLDSTDLSSADLSNADLTGATVTGANTLGTTWTGATCMDGFPALTHVAGSCVRTHDTVGPVTRLAAVASPAIVTSGQRLPITATDTNGTGYQAFRLRYQTAASGTTSFGGWSTETGFTVGSTAWMPSTPGRRTCVQSQGRDVAGNLGAWSPSVCFDTVLDDSSPAMAWGTRWTKRNASGWFERSYSSTKHRGDWYRSNSTKTVRRVGILATTCPTCGKVAVYVGTTYVGRISLKRSTTTARTLLLLPRTARALHGKVRITVVSTKKLVRLDGIALSAY